jgi:hypothetical protein
LTSLLYPQHVHVKNLQIIENSRLTTLTGPWTEENKNQEDWLLRVEVLDMTANKLTEDSASFFKYLEPESLVHLFLARNQLRGGQRGSD